MASVDETLMQMVQTSLNMVLQHSPDTIKYYFEQAYGSEADLMYSRRMPWSLQDLFAMTHKHWQAVFRENYRDRLPQASQVIKQGENIIRGWLSQRVIQTRRANNQICSDAEIVSSQAALQPEDVRLVLQAVEVMVALFNVHPDEKAAVQKKLGEWQYQLRLLTQ